MRYRSSLKPAEADRTHYPFELLFTVRGAIRNSSLCRKHFDDRVKRSVPEELLTSTLYPDVRRIADAVVKLCNQPRFANSRLANYQCGLAFAFTVRSQRFSKSRNSSSRPTKGVSFRCPAEMSLGCLLIGRRERTQSRKVRPPVVVPPFFSTTKSPETSLWVVPVISTVPGSAAACTRAAMPGASPKMSASFPLPAPRPTTTMPESMPTRPHSFR